MAQTLEQTQQEILNIQLARMAELNENNKRFQAIESAIKMLQSAQTAPNSAFIVLEDEVKTTHQAQLLINKLVQGQLKDLESKLNKPIEPKIKLFNWFR